MNAVELFACMPADRALETIEHARATNKALYRDMMARVARARRVHPAVLDRIPRSERHPWIHAILREPAAIEAAYQCLSQWLMSRHAPMLSAFLDTFGIPHDGRGCAEAFPEKPPAAADIRRAVDALLSKFPAPDVAIYLHAFNGMPDTRWEDLDRLLKEDPRLRLEATPA